MNFKRLFSYLPIVLISFLWFSCSNDEDPKINSDISSEAQLQIDWLNNMLDIMEANSVNRKVIDWPTFRGNVLDAARGKERKDELDEVLRNAISLLGDNHSFIVKPSGQLLFGPSNLDCFSRSVSVVDIENVGYIKVPGFSGNPEEARNFAKDLQVQIQEQDDENLTGWVVDLRNNSGGDMWPMLAGIGPILGEGIAGYFVDLDNSKSEWGYFDGNSRLSGQDITTVDNPYELLNPNPKVAVLFNRACGSSGEAIIVAFKERPNTRSFGEPSCGVSTANLSFDLGDGYTLFLTVSTFADKYQNRYGDRIPPDETILDQEALWVRVEEWMTN